MDAFAGEFFWFARNETDTFAKGFIGGGGLNNGNLDDEDYNAGQVKFSDTFSKIRGSDLIYGTIDICQRFTLADGPTRVTLGPFAGFNFWQEMAEGYGARCNPDDIGGALCGPPGSFAVPFSTQVIENEANWASLRLGAELKVRLWDRLTLVGDAAVLPVACLERGQPFAPLRSRTGSQHRVARHGLGLSARRRDQARHHAVLGDRRRRALLVCRGRRQDRLHPCRHQGAAQRIRERAPRRVRRGLTF